MCFILFSAKKKALCVFQSQRSAFSSFQQFPLFQISFASLSLSLSGVRAAVYEKILLSSVGCLPLLLLLICVHPFVFLQKVACIILSSRFCVFLFYFLYFCDTPGRDSGGKKYTFLLCLASLLSSQTKNPTATPALSVTRDLFWGNSL
jgi:hypothetical protein